MRSTFHGLEVSKRALYTTSTSLHTVGHNIANASTEGYTRQRVDQSAANPLYFPGMQRVNTPGQLGMGVEYLSITRVRDSYLDLQYRRENQAAGMWNVHKQALNSIEDIINEPSDSGLSSVMDKFWNSLEVLNRDPSLLSARIDFIGSAKNMADTFKHVNTSLNVVESDAEAGIAQKLEQANTLISGIAQLNETIRKVEALGDNANDYRDQRDVLVDKLSTIVDVQFAEDANGMLSIFSGGVQVVNGANATALTAANVGNITAGEVAGYKKAIEEVELIRNQLNAMVNTLVNGEVDVTLQNGIVAPHNLVALNNVTLEDGTTITAGQTIPTGTVVTSSITLRVNGFNGLRELGYSLSDPAESGISFFTTSDGSPTFDMSNIQVNPYVESDTSKVAASSKYVVIDGANITVKGNSDIAHALAGLRDKTFNYPANMTSLSSGTTDDYFRALVGDLGTRSNIAATNYKNQTNLVDGVEMRRQSVSGVSLDEEMTDLIRFQHAYNAAARNMTTVDEMLDRIINQMGLVGR